MFSTFDHISNTRCNGNLNLSKLVHNCSINVFAEKSWKIKVNYRITIISITAYQICCNIFWLFLECGCSNKHFSKNKLVFTFPQTMVKIWIHNICFELTVNILFSQHCKYLPLNYPLLSRHKYTITFLRYSQKTQVFF